jgi:hypothetical protein
MAALPTAIPPAVPTTVSFDSLNRRKARVFHQKTRVLGLSSDSLSLEKKPSTSEAFAVIV